MTERLSADVTSLPGIGPKLKAKLSKIGLNCLYDFIGYFPRAYEDRSVFFTVADAVRQQTSVCVRAVCAAEPHTANIRKGMSITKAAAFDQTASFELVFFNNPYLKGRLVPGREYDFFGRVEMRYGRAVMQNPEFEPAQKGAISGKILPIYRYTEGINRRIIMTGVSAALAGARGNYDEPLPSELVQKYRLLSPEQAFEWIHNPPDSGAITAARRRLAFEELFVFCCAMQTLKSSGHQVDGALLKRFSEQDFFKLLPFTPTEGQESAISDAFSDMTSGRRMNRLLQGDVGSGKTAVAAACAWLTVKNGRQAGIMAPTELLARQHFHTFKKIFSQEKISIELLSGELTAAQKKDVRKRTANGEIDILIGTHALLQQATEFKNPGLFVVDEQHRFGVAQRSALLEKGQDAHLLVMSATPIPRTLTLILYGDLDISVMRGLPGGRSPIQTYAIGQDKRKRALDFIRKQVAEGGQAYIVCPLIEDEEGRSDIGAATDYAEKLSQQYPDISIGLLHGKLKPQEKIKIMSDFSEGRLDVLVATTVVEVGVDVPNANIMLVENAERFGLSQLHQLRGRVGRGARESHCILLNCGEGQVAAERLSALCESSDGFKIAERDLKLRGPGQFLGSRQHGSAEFVIADLIADTAMLEEAKKCAVLLMENDPELNNYPILKNRVNDILNTEKAGLN